VIVDANILLCAHNADDPHHEAAREWLEAVLNGTTRVGLSWWSLTAFMRIVTNSRAYAYPLSAEAAATQVEEWLDAPRAWLAEPTAQYRDVLMTLVRTYEVRGALMTDAQLAALAIDHGVPVMSTDTDFARFDAVEWINPLRPS
jgi:toxin-antitoxin system PIN domain toxin